MLHRRDAMIRFGQLGLGALNVGANDDTSSMLKRNERAGCPVVSPSRSWRRLEQQFEELSFGQSQHEPAHEP
jgi:hypothetical protein